jgi:gluconolactonase
VVNAVSQLTPERKVIADRWADGGVLTVRPNDLAADGLGGAWFTAGCLYYAGPGGVTVAAENLFTNGIVLSADEKTLFVTNASEIVAFDVAGPGRLTNRRTFARMPTTDQGDGVALDVEGRLYVTTVASPTPGVHVFDRTGQHLGLIPAPRPLISVAFGGPGKKTLFVVGSGADDADGKIIRVGPQQTSATLYTLPLLSAGLPGRAK